jgi:hypothetical protein
VLRTLKRLVILAIIGAVIAKVLDAKSGSKTTGSASWPPIKTSGSGAS